MAPARFLPLSLLVLTAIVCAIVAESSPPVIHRLTHTRFVRRNFQQTPGDDSESGGVVPIRHKAPPPAFMYDEDLVRFVQCHYDPSVADCDENKHDGNEESVTSVRPTGNASQEITSGEAVDATDEVRDQPAIDKLIQADGDQDDDDYSYLIDDSIVEYINKHLDPTTD